MGKLYHCNTVYATKPPTDLNPLILRRHRQGSILALCAREEMVKRINKMITAPDYPYPEQHLLAYGWWEAEETGLVLPSKMLNYDDLASPDAVVIISRARIDPHFLPLVEAVERFFACPQSLPAA